MLIKVRLLTTAATFTALLAEKDPVVVPDGFMPIYATEEALAVGTPVVVPWQSQGEAERLRLGVVAEQLTKQASDFDFKIKPVYAVLTPTLATQRQVQIQQRGQLVAKMQRRARLVTWWQHQEKLAKKDSQLAAMLAELQAQYQDDEWEALYQQVFGGECDWSEPPF